MGLSKQGAVIFRFADDIFIFAENRAIGDALIDVLDEKLTMIGLERSIEKTKWFDDRDDAISSLKKTWLIEFRIIYLQRKQLCLLPEGHHQGGALAHPLERATRMDAQLGEAARAEVG